MKPFRTGARPARPRGYSDSPAASEGFRLGGKPLSADRLAVSQRPHLPEVPSGLHALCLPRPRNGRAATTCSSDAISRESQYEPLRTRPRTNPGTASAIRRSTKEQDKGKARIATSSAAAWRSRYGFDPNRRSKTTFCPSVKPSSRRPSIIALSRSTSVGPALPGTRCRSGGLGSLLRRRAERPRGRRAAAEKCDELAPSHGDLGENARNNVWSLALCDGLSGEKGKTIGPRAMPPNVRSGS